MKNNKIFIMNRQQGKSTLAKLIADANRKDSLLVFNNIAQLINYRNRKEDVRYTIISELIKYKTSHIKYLIIDDYIKKSLKIIECLNNKEILDGLINP
jgi:hypothetical protein